MDVGRGDWEMFTSHRIGIVELRAVLSLRASVFCEVANEVDPESYRLIDGVGVWYN